MGRKQLTGGGGLVNEEGEQVEEVRRKGGRRWKTNWRKAWRKIHGKSG